MAVQHQPLGAAQRQVVEQGVHFYGEVRDRLDFEETVMAQVVHIQDRTLPTHEHAMPYFALIVKGHYEEEGNYGYDQYEPFTVMFNPIMTRHSGTVLRGGVTFFTAEIGPRWLEPFARTALDRTVSDTHGGELAWLSLRLYREHSEGQHASPLTMESLMWEMLASTARLRDCDVREKPSWWEAVRSKLHDDFAEPLRISDLARQAGVHPVYLARAFRKMTAQTPGEYLQGIRLQHACKLLVTEEKSIADIAAESGFSDQSHLTRLLKRRSGHTPAQLKTFLLRTAH